MHVDVNAIACILWLVSQNLLPEIERFLAETGMGEFRFGLLSARNGRLVERLRKGRRVWPETESQIRAYMISERALKKAPARPVRGSQAGAGR